MSIFSIITGIGNNCTEDEWNQFGNDCFKMLVNDMSVIKLINDSMKLEHFTVIKPLIEVLSNFIKIMTLFGILGNILVIDDQLAQKLVEMPEFYSMIKF